MPADDEFASRTYPVQEDMQLQRRKWRIERCGWWGLGLVMLAALFGLFGTGMLSSAHALSDSGQLRVDYDRFGRFGAPTELVIRTLAGPDGKAWLEIDAQLFTYFTLESLHPQPRRAWSDDHVMRLQFEAEPGHWTVAYLGGRPRRPGIFRTGVRGDGGALAFTQFIYP